jgi:hypothetical protein
VSRNIFDDFPFLWYIGHTNLRWRWWRFSPEAVSQRRYDDNNRGLGSYGTLSFLNAVGNKQGRQLTDGHRND